MWLRPYPPSVRYSDDVLSERDRFRGGPTHYVSRRDNQLLRHGLLIPCCGCALQPPGIGAGPSACYSGQGTQLHCSAQQVYLSPNRGNEKKNRSVKTHCNKSAFYVGLRVNIRNARQLMPIAMSGMLSPSTPASRSKTVRIPKKVRTASPPCLGLGLQLNKHRVFLSVRHFTGTSP